jgi:hypothetical protein
MKILLILISIFIAFTGCESNNDIDPRVNVVGDIVGIYTGTIISNGVVIINNYRLLATPPVTATRLDEIVLEDINTAGKNGIDPRITNLPVIKITNALRLTVAKLPLPKDIDQAGTNVYTFTLKRPTPLSDIFQEAVGYVYDLEGKKIIVLTLNTFTIKDLIKPNSVITYRGVK